MKQNQFDENQPSSIPSDESKATSALSATPPDQTPSWLLSRALTELEKINTAKVAAVGLSAEATAVSGARVYLDRLGEYPLLTGERTQEIVDRWGLNRRISGRNLTSEDVLDLVKRLTRDSKSSASLALSVDAEAGSVQHDPKSFSTPRGTWDEAIRVAQDSVTKSQAAKLDTAAAEILIRRLEAARDRTASPDEVVAEEDQETENHLVNEG